MFADKLESYYPVILPYNESYAVILFPSLCYLFVLFPLLIQSKRFVVTVCRLSAYPKLLTLL